MPKKFTKFQYWNDPKRCVADTLRSWIPKDPKDKRLKEPKTEKRWEQAIVDRLHMSLPDLQIIPQVGKGMARGDIAVEVTFPILGRRQDIIELKLGLKSTGALQRLKGQIDDYVDRARRGYIFVVICGSNVDPKLIYALKDFCKKKYNMLFVFHKEAKRGLKTIV